MGDQIGQPGSREDVDDEGRPDQREGDAGRAPACFQQNRDEDDAGNVVESMNGVHTLRAFRHSLALTHEIRRAREHGGHQDHVEKGNAFLLVPPCAGETVDEQGDGHRRADVRAQQNDVVFVSARVKRQELHEAPYQRGARIDVADDARRYGG